MAQASSNSPGRKGSPTPLRVCGGSLLVEVHSADGLRHGRQPCDSLAHCIITSADRLIRLERGSSTAVGSPHARLGSSLRPSAPPVQLPSLHRLSGDRLTRVISAPTSLPKARVHRRHRSDVDDSTMREPPRTATSTWHAQYCPTPSHARTRYPQREFRHTSGYPSATNEENGF